ncbi:serine/threonine-protein kinase [Sesbania bispinosa]|nr:serine/threonine-protein kinase [Sesbania bispinosa]
MIWRSIYLASYDLPADRLYDSVKDVSSVDGSWHFDSFSPWLPNHVVAKISANLAARDDLGQDRLVWKFSHDGNFSTSLAYVSIHDFPSVDDSKWKLLWH